MSWLRGFGGFVIVAVVVAMLAACGATTSAHPEATLASWGEQVCSMLESLETDSPAPTPAAASSADPTQIFSGTVDGRLPERIRALVTRLRAIPAPDEQRNDIDEFLDLFAASADRYETALPRLQAASRRLELAMKSIDRADLPPAPEGTTGAVAIISQMMSVPAFKDAFDDQIALYEELDKGGDETEDARLEKAVGLDKCGRTPGEAGEPLTAAQLERCASKGRPVSLQTLVDTFQAHGISLVIEEHTCVVPVGERVAGFDSDATNTGPTVSEIEKIRSEQGQVTCDVNDAGVDHQLVVHDTDIETTFRVHNVDCALYPYEPAVEAEQIGQVKQAMEAVAASVPTP